ncbi:MAG: proline racemase family protein [Vicinamibacterales bacterium]
MVYVLKTIDAHAAGEPLRLVTDGMPRPAGRTMLEKREWMRRHADHLRRALMLEPRGHADMYGALLTEPVSPGSHAGVLFMHNEGYSTMCGHGVIAVTTVAIERGLLFDRQGLEVVLDTPAGTVHARPRIVQAGDSTRVDAVAFTNVPAFVHLAGHAVKLGSREVRVDIAFGGAFYAIVDTESVGTPLEARRLPELRRIATDIKAALESSVTIAHPSEPRLTGLYGVIFTGPPADPEAHLRNLTVFADAEVDRSPCGTGTSAVMAVLDAMGLLPAEGPFVHESLIGTLFRGQLLTRTRVGELPAIVTEIEGSAWITGEHTFYIDDEDPLREGFRI